MHTRAARLGRGWVIGGFSTALAALSHAFAGGGTPGGLALVTGVVFGGMLGTLVVGRRPSLPRLAIAVGGSQFAFHALFSALGSASPLTAVGAATGTGPHDHGGAMVLAVGAPHPHVDGAGMWLAHAAAGVVTLALLRGAERAAWRLLTELARLVVAPFRSRRPAPHPVPRRLAPLTVAFPALLVARALSAAVSRRGPPVSLAF